ncbi:hypothetical protein M0805_007750 [Coniferiporia weirii]|nr:hypothetical protein M0805_007750 [Coniferiporia weirii]
MASKDDSTTQLDTLISLISESVANITAEYEEAYLPIPTLDPIPAAHSHRKLSDDANVRVSRAAKIVEAACAQLCATILNPGHVLLNKATAYEESACLQVVTDARIADLLLDKPEGLHVSELSTLTGLNSDKLARTMRLLATAHTFCEVKPNTFANNRISLELLSTKPCHAVVDIVTNEQMKAASYFNESLKDPSPSVPFERVYGTTIMKYFTAPDLHQRRDVWARGIAGWLDVGGEEGLHKIYPWSERLEPSKQITVCDIGAGNGHVTLDLLRAFEDQPIRAVVQDLPPTLDLSREFWGKNYPKALQESRVNFVPINFFDDTPVEGCDYYYMRFCLHNWSDELFVKILGNVAKAMQKKADSRLLIHDIVLDHPVKDADDASLNDNIAPEPLLPNYGSSRFQEYAGDLNMMILMDAKERSLKEMVTLATRAGLTFDRIHRSVNTSIVEFKLA